MEAVKRPIAKVGNVGKGFLQNGFFKMVAE